MDSLRFGVGFFSELCTMSRVLRQGQHGPRSLNSYGFEWSDLFGSQFFNLIQMGGRTLNWHLCPIFGIVLLQGSVSSYCD